MSDYIKVCKRCGAQFVRGIITAQLCPGCRRVNMLSPKQRRGECMQQGCHRPAIICRDDLAGWCGEHQR